MSNPKKGIRTESAIPFLHFPHRVLNIPCLSLYAKSAYFPVRNSNSQPRHLKAFDVGH